MLAVRHGPSQRFGDLLDSIFLEDKSFDAQVQGAD